MSIHSRGALFAAISLIAFATNAAAAPAGGRAGGCRPQTTSANEAGQATQAIADLVRYHRHRFEKCGERADHRIAHHHLAAVGGRLRLYRQHHPAY